MGLTGLFNYIGSASDQAADVSAFAIGGTIHFPCSTLWVGEHLIQTLIQTMLVKGFLADPASISGFNMKGKSTVCGYQYRQAAEHGFN